MSAGRATTRGLVRRRSRGLSEMWRSEDSWHRHRHQCIDADNFLHIIGSRRANAARCRHETTQIYWTRPANLHRMTLSYLSAIPQRSRSNTILKGHTPNKNDSGAGATSMRAGLCHKSGSQFEAGHAEACAQAVYTGLQPLHLSIRSRVKRIAD